MHGNKDAAGHRVRRCASLDYWRSDLNWSGNLEQCDPSHPMLQPIPPRRTPKRLPKHIIKSAHRPKPRLHRHVQNLPIRRRQQPLRMRQPLLRQILRQRRRKNLFKQIHRIVRMQPHRPPDLLRRQWPLIMLRQKARDLLGLAQPLRFHGRRRRLARRRLRRQRQRQPQQPRLDLQQHDPPLRLRRPRQIRTPRANASPSRRATRACGSDTSRPCKIGSTSRDGKSHCRNHASGTVAT